MRTVTCSSFGAVMREEWSVISSGRWAKTRHRHWIEAEPILGDLGSVTDVADAISIPIGHSREFSLAVTQAVFRLAVEDPLATRLILHVMVPMLAKECFKSLQIIESQGVRLDDSEIITIVLGSASDAIASLVGSEQPFPLRILRQRTIKRISRRRQRLISNLLELTTETPIERSSPIPEKPPAVLLARTLQLAVGKGIVSPDDARLVWASTHRGETSMTLAGGDKREAERLRRRRSRAQRRLVESRSELLEAIAV